MSDDCVVDASVGVKLFVNEDLSEVADRLFARLTAQPVAQFYVPDLFYVECTNILRKYVRCFVYPPENARQDVVDLRALALVTVSTANLLEPALTLALAHDITAYAASYAVLAQQLNLPLITADTTLARKLAGSGVIVQTLADLKEP
ncbi:MAG: twitching motility protein PilT [Anaerolineae bacterium]|nr:twitching motility protein PilT [Anaerolineae bacterium]